MDKKYIIGIAVLLFALGYGAGKYSQPKSKEETTTTDVNKTVEDTTKVIETKKPDGTIVVEKIKTIKKETDIKTSDTVKIVNNPPNYHIKALAGLNKDLMPVYGISAEKRILANVFAGLWATTDKQIGISIGMEF